MSGASLPSEFEVIRDVAARLDQASIPYMLTGSMAMNFYALPRMTRDIDLVVELGAADVQRMVTLFLPSYYVSRSAVEEAVQTERMFNLIHQESIIKVDCIVRKSSTYRRSEFQRRQRSRIHDLDLWLVTKEDLVLSKLVWAKDSHSELQLGDVRRLLGTGCDQAYLDRWAGQLEVVELLEECRHD